MIQPAVTHPEAFCGFCSKSQYAVESVIVGKHGFICNECVPLCVGLLEEQRIEKLVRKALEAKPEKGGDAA